MKCCPFIQLVGRIALCQSNSPNQNCLKAMMFGLACFPRRTRVDMTQCGYGYGIRIRHGRLQQDMAASWMKEIEVGELTWSRHGSIFISPRISVVHLLLCLVFNLRKKRYTFLKFVYEKGGQVQPTNNLCLGPVSLEWVMEKKKKVNLQSAEDADRMKE